MANAWLPWPVALGWAAVCGLAFAMHTHHAEVTTGQHQVWHGSHALMALGMLVMYLPTPTMVVPPLLGAAVFLVAVVVLVAGLVAVLLRGVDVGRAWVVTLVDLAWMAYMFDAMHRPNLAWSLLGAAWFLGQTLVCSRGGLVLGPGLRGVPRDGPAPVIPARGPGRDGVMVLDRSYRKSMRVSMTLMSVGMAYMLLATRFGVVAVPGPDLAPLHPHH